MLGFGKKEQPAQQQQRSPVPSAFSGSLYSGGEQDRDFLGELDGFNTSLGSEMKGRVKIMEDTIREARTQLAKYVTEQQKLEIVGSQLKQFYTHLKGMVLRQVTNVKTLQFEYKRILAALGIPEEEIQQRCAKLGIKTGGK